MGMRTIDVEFAWLEEHPVAALFGTHGVYVLWGPEANHTPTYLGEGLLLSRLNQHTKWLSREVTGLVAVADAKPDAEVVETVLLWAASETNRWPKKNTNHGKWKRLVQAFDRHTSIRINIRGRDPFIHPASKYSILRERKQISVKIDREGWYLEAPWNSRAGR